MRASRRARRTTATSSTSRGSAIAWPADVDDRLPHHLDAAHQGDVADALRELGEALRFGDRPVVGNASAGVRAEERVAQRSQQVVGDAPRIVTRHQHLVHAHQHAGDVFRGRCVEHRDALLEGHSTERGVHLRVVELAAADRERLVEQRERIARRSAGPARDEVERLVVGFDALAREHVGGDGRRARRARAG